MSVPYGIYKNVLQEFFEYFVQDIVIQSINKNKIKSKYFIQILL